MKSGYLQREAAKRKVYQEFYPFAKRYPEIKEITYGGER